MASVASDSAVAATALKRNDILNTPKFGHVKMNAPWVRHLLRSPEVRSLNLFQGMPLVSAAFDDSPWKFEGFGASWPRRIGQRNAGHSRLISFAFYPDRAERVPMLATSAVAIPHCIRAPAQFCSTSHQACPAGSDLILTVTNLQQISPARCDCNDPDPLPWRKSSPGEGRDSRHRSPAEALSKG